MKKRILSILLLCCMVLTLLPTTAFALTSINVSTEEELLTALADKTIDRIGVTSDITVSRTLEIDRQVVLVLDHRLKIDREQSGSGTLFHITKSGYLDTNAGSITDNVLNEGKFFPRQISGEVINEGEIIRGSFSGKVKNRGSINYGSFRGEVENAPGGKIANGELYGEVTNHGEIAGREFYGKVTNEADGLITSGEFYGEVVNNGIISYGKFYGDVVNNGTITGGSFFGTLTGGEIQDNAYIAVTFDSDGGSTVAAQRILRGQKAQRPAAPTKDGYTFIGWYNKADLQYINLPEWNFDYPVFENMELVAQWMEARPISTDPVAYLDENGQTKYCTKYSVLTSETKKSILDYDDKWYDLPAGWYVVEGDVTITPRLDTHGAVNLILKDDCHLTVPWGINVKEGDTFTIYAQSTAEASMGKLTACLPELSDHEKSVWPVAGLSGIGAGVRVWAANDNFYENEGTIIINGGNIHAKGQQGSSAIGGSDYEHNVSSDGDTPGNLRQGGSITINGGTVKASSEGDGFGIGGAGVHHTAEMHITINGGNIETTANRNNAAIGDKSKHKSSVTITGGVIHAVGKGSAAGIGSIGGVDCKSITINGNVIKSISSTGGACIGGAAGGSVGSITISDAELPLLSAEKILIGWDADSPGGKLTIRNCRVASTDILSDRTDGIRVGSNSELVIENSEIRLPHFRSIRVGGNGSIAVRDSDLHTYGIFMDETVQSPNDAKTLKKLEITDSTVLTGDIIGARGGYSSVEEVVIHDSSIRLNDAYTYNYCTIGGGTNGSFGSIDIQNSQIHIPSSGGNTAIGNGWQVYYNRESRIRIANSEVSVRCASLGPAIGAAWDSGSGRINIIIENSTVTAKGGNLRTDGNYVPGIGKNALGRAPEIGIQILNSTVDSFRLTEKGGTDYVYDDLHTKELPGIPAENITICGSTVNGTRIAHSFDEYGKCTLCGKYDLGYCYEHGLLTMEGLTDCVYDGSEKKLTGLSHQTGENETKQLAENTDYTASYSNNVAPYTLTPEDEGFDPAKAPKVTLYGTGNYCGKAEHYFTISTEAPAAEHTVTVKTDGNGTASASPAKAAAGAEITLTATPNTGYHFKEWQVISGGVTIKDDKFTMPSANVEVKAIFKDMSKEQFTLAPGGTYYFDLSAMGIPGTVNDALPDKTMHYVPFTYAGTVDAYKLTSAMVATDEYAEKNKYPHSLFMADHTVTHTVSWDELNAGRLIFGRDYAAGGVDYILRAPSVGSGRIGSAESQRGTPPSNEWDRILDKNDGYIKNWFGMYSWGQDTLSTSASDRAARGYFPPGGWSSAPASHQDAVAGFRPVLEVLNPGSLGSDGLKAVTLDLGGGKLGDESSIQIIVETGSVFTAPASDGLTRPDGNTGNYFMWRDNDGQLYAPGDYVPADVTKLTAQFAPDTYTVTIITEGGGTASASPAKAAANTEITLSATPNEGYHFHEWQIMSGGVTIKDDKFTMPDSNVEVKAVFEEDAPPVPTDPAKPSISVTGTYTYNGSEHTATVSGYDPATMDISGNTATDAGDYTVSVTSQTGKWADGSTEAVTAVWSIGKATQEAPDGLSSVAPATEGGSDGKITGVTDKMEYRMAGESIYTACSGTEIENLSAGNYFVRYAEDHNHFASPDAEVTVGEGASLADCTITFNAGGGSGSMEPVTVKARTNYILPDCGFTAPADQEFKAWEISGTEYKVGDSYTVLGDTEIKALWENSVITPTTYTVTVSNDGNGTGTAAPSTAAAGTEITLTAKPNEGYHFKEWKVISGGVTIKDDKFLMPNDNVEVKAIFEKDTGGGGGGYNPPVTYYTLRFETGGGSDIPSVQGTYNTYIDLTKYVPTWRGHTFIGWYSERSLMNKVSGVYLTKDMTVYAGWRVDENPNTGANPFTDVSEKDWFYGDVMFVYENGLMLGTSKTLFSPHGTATRGMMATILWRMEGSPAPKGKNSFTDVEAGKWYADAITWTAENGIFAGYGKDKFGPDDPITREQLAAIFYRYADYKGYDLTVKGNLDKFKDADKITDYAKTAMQWAVGSGLVKGKSGNLLDPQGTATRAEIAAMLHRFIEKYELVQGKAPGGLMGWIDPKRLQIPKTGDSSVLGL